MEHVKHEAKGAASAPPPQPPRNLEFEVVGNTIMVTNKDDLGYIMSVGMIPIDTIIRATYYVPVGELELVVAETIGSFYDRRVWVLDEKGEKTEETRYAPIGNIQAASISFRNDKVAKKILKKFLNILNDDIFDKTFKGFGAHKAHERKMDEIQKKVEADQAKRAKEGPPAESKILDMHGHPVPQPPLQSSPPVKPENDAV